MNIEAARARHERLIQQIADAAPELVRLSAEVEAATVESVTFGASEDAYAVARSDARAADSRLAAKRAEVKTLLTEAERLAATLKVQPAGKSGRASERIQS